ncbi:MAG: hypothetical protein GC178_06140 [Flavobacteriales bacterium]|nr:hypothetical protein [Flavobacteriales bacterium]
MLLLNIKRLLELRNIRSGRSYLVNHGYTDNEARWLLSETHKMIRLKMMDRLCVTFNCPLEDLYEWKGGTDHPLGYLRRSQVKKVNQLLEGKSPQELEELIRKLENGEI